LQHFAFVQQGSSTLLFDHTVGAQQEGSGIVRLSAFAVVRFTTSSKVGLLDRQIAGLDALEDLEHDGRSFAHIVARQGPYDMRPPASTCSFHWWIAGSRCSAARPIGDILDMSASLLTPDVLPRCSERRDVPDARAHTTSCSRRKADA
jgi:hypothetical protein